MYGIAVPDEVHLEVKNESGWRPVRLVNPLLSPLRARCTTRLHFAEVRASQVRVVFRTKPGLGCGLAQFQAWGKIQKKSREGPPV